MTLAFDWSDAAGALYSPRGRFDSWTLAWREAPAAGRPGDLRPVTAPEALRAIKAAAAPRQAPEQGGPRPLRGVPIGVIGPREAAAGERTLAAQLGAALAEHGLQLLCGGKGGVMEAASRGCLAAGGTPIGLVPDGEWHFANPYVAIPIATGIGPARNAIIARACLVLVAVGGGYGTLSEMALGLQFERLVLTLGDAPKVDGALPCADVDEAVERIAARVLGGSAPPS